MKKCLMILAVALLALPLGANSADAAKYKYKYSNGIKVQLDFQNMHKDAKDIRFDCYDVADSQSASASNLSIPENGTFKGMSGVNMPSLHGFNGDLSNKPKIHVYCSWSIQGPGGKLLGASEGKDVPIWARAKKGTLSKADFDVWIIGEKTRPGDF